MVSPIQAEMAAKEIGRGDAAVVEIGIFFRNIFLLKSWRGENPTVAGRKSHRNPTMQRGWGKALDGRFPYASAIGGLNSSQVWSQGLSKFSRA